MSFLYCNLHRLGAFEVKKKIVPQCHGQVTVSDAFFLLFFEFEYAVCAYVHNYVC